MSKKTTVVCGCGNEFTLDNAPRRRLKAERDAALHAVRDMDAKLAEMASHHFQCKRQIADLTAQIQRQAQQIIDERAARKMPQWEE